MALCVWKSLCRSVALAFVILAPVTISAQVAASVKKAPGPEPPPKWNLFLGYSFLSPHGSVDMSPDLRDTNLPVSYHHVTLGGDFSYSYFFGRVSRIFGV
jgi:hypothetical protein